MKKNLAEETVHDLLDGSRAFFLKKSATDKSGLYVSLASNSLCSHVVFFSKGEG